MACQKAVRAQTPSRRGSVATEGRIGFNLYDIYAISSLGKAKASLYSKIIRGCKSRVIKIFIRQKSLRVTAALGQSNSK